MTISFPIVTMRIVTHTGTYKLRVISHTDTHWPYVRVFANVLDSLPVATEAYVCQNVSCQKVAAWGCETDAARRQRTRRDIKTGRACG